MTQTHGTGRTQAPVFWLAVAATMIAGLGLGLVYIVLVLVYGWIGGTAALAAIVAAIALVAFAWVKFASRLR